MKYALILLFSFLLAACAPAAKTVPPSVIQTEKGQYTNISTEEMSAMLKEKDFIFVNVHTPFEGNIPGTDLSIPYDQIAQHLDQLPDKGAKIVLYCRSDRMSTIAARELANLGYTNLYNLTGGMAAWEQAGKTIER